MISRLVFHHTQHLLLCPPFKQIKVSLSPLFFVTKKKQTNKQNRILCQPDMRPFFVFDLLNLPWTWLTFSIPKELIYVLDILHHSNDQTSARLFLGFCGYLDNSAGLNACSSVSWRKHASTLQPFSCPFYFLFSGFFFSFFALFILHSFHLRTKMDWQHKIKYFNLKRSDVVDWVHFSFLCHTFVMRRICESPQC